MTGCDRIAESGDEPIRQLLQEIVPQYHGCPDSVMGRRAASSLTGQYRLTARNRLMKNFALIGAAGYIAPRHMQAIHDTGNRLAAAVDPHDCVGRLDAFFPEARFFTEIERFDRYLEKVRRGPEEDRVHYVSICSPNYLHDRTSAWPCALSPSATAAETQPIVKRRARAAEIAGSLLKCLGRAINLPPRSVSDSGCSSWPLPRIDYCFTAKDFMVHHHAVCRQSARQ